MVLTLKSGPQSAAKSGNLAVPANLVFRGKIWGARDNGMPPMLSILRSYMNRNIVSWPGRVQPKKMGNHNLSLLVLWRWFACFHRFYACRPKF